MMQSRVTRTDNKDKGQSRKPLSSPAYFDAKHESTHSPRTTDRTKTSRWNKAHVTPAQNRRIAHDKPARVRIYADMVKVDYPPEINGKKPRSTEFRGGGIRSTVTGFSRASRKRMIEYMARVRHSGEMMFLTMTYDDDSLQRDDFDMKAEFEAFRRRFERAFPSWSALWRMEMMKRKSGDLSGIDVPHYHMIIFVGKTAEGFSQDEICQAFISWGAVAWQKITSSFDPYHLEYGFHCTPIRSRKQAYAYVSKYVGKHAEDEHEVGRRWGKIGQMDLDPSEEFRLSDDEMTIFKGLVKRWLRDRAEQRLAAWLANPKNKGKETPTGLFDFVKRFEQSFDIHGFTVFGLGDSCTEAGIIDLYPLVVLFLYEAKAQALELPALERGYGD